ncbi:glycerophosphodiester phosphodiesterase [Catelliglobosispora koreensis]|uniref:glycerophosphodiester phosphodiesterase n=1 Tax=Catelliglobosispora koreensis TaxID=129052 RepID=UPI000363DCF8|nr:glycerophosphodiester phosphodiesterase [Catelliglobosispora koreensis]
MTDRRQLLTLAALTAGSATLASGAFAANAQASPNRPKAKLVIGHRGASGHRPEHTLAAYELAARMGADFIEPDLVITADGVLVARHENEISGTTDVATRTEFAGRKTTKSIDGVNVTGWFTEDFTLAELKTLRAIERIPATRQRNTLFNGLFQVPTLDEVLELRKRLSRELGREIGVYPETKHPTYFQSIGNDLETPLVRTLRRHGLDHRNAPVFVQSFEAANLRQLKDHTRARLVFLANASGTPFNDPQTYDAYTTPQGLAELATFVSGLGPFKNRVIPVLPTGELGTPSTLVSDAHAAGLVVHPWTFRAENQFLPPSLRTSTDLTAYGKAIDEQIAFWNAGIDGMFSDQPDISVLSRELS